MREFLTLSERKTIETDRRRAAIDAIKPKLARFGAENQGRFLIFGSAVAGRIRYSSDLDIVIDFPLQTERAAFDFVEDLAAEQGIPLDAFPLRELSPTFLERIGPGAIVLP